MPIEEQEQKIKAMGLFPSELQLEPANVRELSLNNKFQRTLPLLSAWTGNKQVLLRATTGGLLKVTSYSAVFDKYEVNPTSGTPGYIEISGSSVNTETFSEVMSKIDVMVNKYAIYIEISADGTTFGDKIMLEAGDVFSEYVSCKAIRLSNVVTDGTQNGKYQVIGYK
ncbi:MAG: hypothetical protein DRJ64_02160 [Thermoprotei archaeon]|nr:MAG: hypothetical protein DRJ64_02160 [Thermoprotei archaeon]